MNFRPSMAEIHPTQDSRLSLNIMQQIIIPIIRALDDKSNFRYVHGNIQIVHCWLILKI